MAQATVDVTLDRLAGFREVFPQAPGVMADASLVDEGMIAARTLLTDADGALHADRPTAIVAQSDLLAVGVIRAAEELGLRVPEDLTVVGFDGIAADGLGSLKLTTIAQPAVAKGRAAGEQVTRMLAGEPGSPCTSPVYSAKGRPPLRCRMKKIARLRQLASTSLRSRLCFCSSPCS
ncbi:hypothetical protein GCM10025863_24880 [Microbacterium suwonense]|uniref:Transcriptional regulator LacI/GalR-like sensor domain-containing protein n=1 Tax=Microbacterium suwonense TaxID=683047 RepID=A0ABM8FWD1_9MICO|nr:hypothetical protein GCM10025863_24880 [Microbacterium suwonense]